MTSHSHQDTSPRSGVDWEPPNQKPAQRRDGDEYDAYLATGGTAYPCKEAWKDAV